MITNRVTGVDPRLSGAGGVILQKADSKYVVISVYPNLTT